MKITNMIKGSREINLNSFSLMFIAYFLLFSTTLCAQITFETNSYRKGDKVERQQVVYMPLEENGQHAVWDLSGMEVMNNTTMRFIGEEADSNKQVVCIAQSRHMPYSLSGESLLIDGYEDYNHYVVVDEADALGW